MKKIIGLLIIAFSFFIACDEEPIGQIPTDSIAPSAVTNVQVEAIEGGAIVTYDIPKDEDLLYVQARYQEGDVERIWKSSVFKNEIVVRGFGDVTEKSISIEAVDRSQNISNSVNVSFNPLTPPVFSVFNTVKVTEDFGGISFSFENPLKAELAFVVLTKNDNDEMEQIEKIYTSVEEGSFAVRGYENKEREFGVYVADRWDNLSDTLSGIFTPLYEEDLDRDMWSHITLPGDIPINAWGGGFHRLIDDAFGGGNYAHTKGGEGMPIPWTFDLGQKVKLSRFISWQRNEEYLYNHGNPRVFELWGSNNPAQDGSWDSWTKLGTFESLKPSGLPLGQVSNEDKFYAEKGEEFIIPLDAPEVRYIRHVTIETWSGGDFFHLGEIKMFGQPVDE